MTTRDLRQQNIEDIAGEIEETGRQLEVKPKPDAWQNLLALHPEPETDVRMPEQRSPSDLLLPPIKPPQPSEPTLFPGLQEPRGVHAALARLPQQLGEYVFIPALMALDEAFAGFGGAVTGQITEEVEKRRLRGAPSGVTGVSDVGQLSVRLAQLDREWKDLGVSRWGVGATPEQKEAMDRIGQEAWEIQDELRQLPAERFRELPVPVQLAVEMIGLTAVGGTATGAREALRPAIARGGFRGGAAEVAAAALAPPAAAEAAVGAVVKHGIVIPVTKGVPAAARKGLQVALDAGLDKWIATQGRLKGSPAQNRIFRAVVGDRQWIIQRATDNLTRRLAERRGTQTAVRNAVADTIGEVENRIIPQIETAAAQAGGGLPPDMPRVPGGGAAKQPWQMTRAEFRVSNELGYEKTVGKSIPQHVDELVAAEKARGNVVAKEVVEASLRGEGYHREAIRTALAEGQPVPPEVLAEYPDLKPAVAPKKPTNAVGRQIAKDLGVKYTGIEKIEGAGYLFTDPDTGSTFFGADLEGAQTRLTEMRQEFAAAELPQQIPGEPEAGLQPGMFGGVEEVRPPGRGRPTQVSMDDQLKLQQAQRDARSEEIDRLLETKGRLPAGTGTKEALRLEAARLEAQKDVESLSPDDLQGAIAEVESELGLRSMPFHGGEKAGPLTRFTTSQLDEMLKVYRAAPETAPVEAVVSAEVAPEVPAEVAPPAVPPEPPSTAGAAWVKGVQEQGRTAPESVPPEDAKVAHTEAAAPDGPKPPKPPTDLVAREPDDIFREILEKIPPGERPDRGLLVLHEGAINNESTRSYIIVKEGGKKLKAKGIGVWRRDNLIPRPQDIQKLDELYAALHNPSGVESGAVRVPEGLEEVYQELRALTDWEQSARLDFDPEMATVEDYFYRGWKPPEGAFADVVQGRPLVKTPSFKKPRVNATYEEMRAAGFEPLFWNPYQQWSISRMQGVKYREQMELVSHLKSMGEELIRPHDGGPIRQGWRVPEVGPAFEGKPFAIADPVTGQPAIMYSRRWIVPDKIANALENIYGKRPSLGKFTVKGLTIDPLSIIDALVFIPKRAKLFASFFQQIDFLTRAGSGSWTRSVDALMAGQPIEAIKAPARYPQTVAKVLRANFSPAKRLSLAKQLQSTEPLVQGRPGITFKGISRAGLSLRDVTIFPADMDKLVHQVAKESGILGKGKRFLGLIGDLESAMRRGLFDGVYSAAIMTDVQNNIAPMIARQYASLNDAQINGMIARVANTKYSTIPASQSVIQNRVLRESLRRLFFSIGESEGLLRQATGAFHGPYKSYWRKHWIGVYLFLITTANVVHFASTGEPLPSERYSPISKSNYGPFPYGYNTEFAAPTLPIKGRGDVEITLDLAGQMDTAFRVLDPINFITSRESVPVRTLANQVTGTNFWGAPIDDVGPGGVISRTSQLLHDMFAPIGVGGIIGEWLRQEIPGAEEIVPRGEERVGIKGLAVQATGVNVRAETTMNLLDRVARDSGFLKVNGLPVETWADLEPSQKRELSNNVELQTELGLRSEAAIERQQLKAEGFSTLDDIDKERVVRGEALVSEFAQGLMEADAFRDEVTLLKREMSARKSQVDIDFQLFKETDVLPTDPNKRALVQYYETFDKAKRASGVLDWDKQEVLEGRLRKQWSDTQEAYVDRNTGLTEWGPLMAEYQQAIAALKPYWEIEGPNQAERRKRYRRKYPEIDEILVKWYGYKSIRSQRSSSRTQPRTQAPTQQAPTEQLPTQQVPGTSAWDRLMGLHVE